LILRLTLELRLPERGRVARDDDELGLAGAQSLERGLVAQSDLARLYTNRKLPAWVCDAENSSAP